MDKTQLKQEIDLYIYDNDEKAITAVELNTVLSDMVVSMVTGTTSQFLTGFTAGTDQQIIFNSGGTLTGDNSFKINISNGSLILGGIGGVNDSTSSYSIISGGIYNSNINSSSSSILTGNNNQNINSYGSFVTGSNNTNNNSYRGFIGGGANNTNNNNPYGAIIGGVYNLISSCFNGVTGGSENVIIGSDNSTITCNLGNGAFNSIYGGYYDTMTLDFYDGYGDSLDGQFNSMINCSNTTFTISDPRHNIAINTHDSQMDSTGEFAYNMIIGGYNNQIPTSYYKQGNIIIGGFGNIMNSTSNTTIINSTNTTANHDYRVYMPRIVLTYTATPSGDSEPGLIFFDGSHFYGNNGTTNVQLD